MGSLMKRTRNARRKALATAAAAVLAMSALLCLDMTPAMAQGAMRAVDEQTFIAKNPLAIKNLPNWDDPRPIAQNTRISTSIALADARDLQVKAYAGSDVEIDADFCGSMELRRQYVHHDMLSNETARQDENGLGWGALVIEFPELRTLGAQGSATIRYPNAGTYRDKEIGADVTYTVSYGAPGDPSSFSYQDSDDYPIIQCAKSLYSGITQFNCNHVDVEVRFFDRSTGEPVDADQGYFTIGSLTDSEGISCSSYEEFWYPERGYLIPQAGYVHGDEEAEGDYVDNVRSNTFWKRAATIFQNGSFAFTAWPSVACRADATRSEAQWWSLSSAAIGTQRPDEPTKSTSATEARPGSVLAYRVAQTVGRNGVDMFGSYRSLSFIDELPPEVAYETGSARMFRTGSGDERIDITESAGTAVLAGRTLRYDFNAGSLETMPLIGETYLFEFEVRVADGIPQGTIIENAANVAINGEMQSTDPVRTWVNAPRISLSKNADGFTHPSGEEVSYTVNASNDMEGSVAREVVISDSGLPHSRIIGEVVVNGVPDAIRYPTIDENGGLVEESRTNAWTVETSRAGWQVRIAYLPAGSQVSISYRISAEGDLENRISPNRAEAKTSNADDAAAITSIFIEPRPAPKKGHEVTVYALPDEGSPKTITVGDRVRSSFEAVNTGTEAAPFTVIRDYLPAGMAFVDGSMEGGGSFVAANGEKPAYAEWIVEDLPPDRRRTVSYLMQATADAPPLVMNTAFYGEEARYAGKPGSSTAALQHETNTIAYSTDSRIPLPLLLDLEETARPSSAEAVQDKRIAYTLELRNNGSTCDKKAILTADIPIGMEYEDASASHGGSYEPEKRRISWIVDAPAAGERERIAFAVTRKDSGDSIQTASQARFDIANEDSDGLRNSSNIVLHAGASPAPRGGGLLPKTDDLIFSAAQAIGVLILLAGTAFWAARRKAARRSRREAVISATGAYDDAGKRP